MKRKLVKQGAATLMISIPSKWAKQFNLDKGDELEVEEEGNKLVLGLEGKKFKKQAEINLSSLTESSIRTVMTNAYRIGYDKIKLKFSDKKAFETIREVVNKNLLGFEIIKKEENHCEIENITEPSGEHFQNLLTKVFLNIDDLFIVTEKMMSGEKREFEDIERNIQKFDNFCRRVLSKGNHLEMHPLQWTFHAELIHAQRELYLLLRHLSKSKKKSSKDDFKLLESCKNIFDMVKEAYTKREIHLLEKIHDLNSDISKEAEKLLEKEKNAIIIHHIYSAARKFYLCNSPLMGIFILEKKD
jgi:phosphate uptake regulator